MGTEEVGEEGVSELDSWSNSAHTEVRTNDKPVLPLLFHVLFQGTRTLLKATKKNREVRHKFKSYNINWRVL